MEELSPEEMMEAAAALDIGMFVALTTAVLLLPVKQLTEVFDQAIVRLEQQGFDEKTITSMRARLDQLLTAAEDNQDGQNS